MGYNRIYIHRRDDRSDREGRGQENRTPENRQQERQNQERKDRKSRDQERQDQKRKDRILYVKELLEEKRRIDEQEDKMEAEEAQELEHGFRTPWNEDAELDQQLRKKCELADQQFRKEKRQLQELMEQERKYKQEQHRSSELYFEKLSECNEQYVIYDDLLETAESELEDPSAEIVKKLKHQTRVLKHKEDEKSATTQLFTQLNNSYEEARRNRQNYEMEIRRNVQRRNEDLLSTT